MMRFVGAVLVISLFSGCTDDAPPAAVDPGLDVSDDTGCIVGVVIDQLINPVVDAQLTISSTGATTTSDENGAFQFCGLPTGTYFINAQRPLHEPSSTSWAVTAGDPNPPLLTIQMARISGATAYIQTHQLDGFYECAFATIFITDSCDFVVRTAYDEGVPAIPRNLQNNVNTGYTDWSESIQTVIQETWWDADSSTTFRSSLQDTPIANDCDCSTKHMEAKGTGGYIFDRMDEGNMLPKNTNGQQTWPALEDLEDGLVAIRGFIPFQSGADVDYAIDLEFQIISSFFHNYQPPEGWNFEQRANFPVPT